MILKFWIHLGRAAQKKRLKQLERDPLTRWRVTARQWKNWRLYDRFVDACGARDGTCGTDYAPWTIIEGDDERYRNPTVSSIVCDAIRTGLAEPCTCLIRFDRSETPEHSAMRSTMLSRLDMSHRVDRSAFRQRWRSTRVA